MHTSGRDLSRLFSQTVDRPLESSVPLCDFSHFRIGGKADFLFQAATSGEFIQAIHFARENSLPYFVIGGGYNLLFDDDGFRGLIICNHVQSIRRRGKEDIESDSGTKLGDLIQFCIKEELGGLEFLAGIPGTVGGAVFGNAGAFEQEIGDFLAEASLLLRSGKNVVVDRSFFQFGYRNSILKEKHEVLLTATFNCHKKNKKKIESLVQENLKKREKKHPPENIACAGSYFKNPILKTGEKIPAAHLLEQAGAKQMRVGGAAVFPGHANFIINQEKASSRDVRELAALLKQRVMEMFGVELEEEVIFLPAESPGL